MRTLVILPFLFFLLWAPLYAENRSAPASPPPSPAESSLATTTLLDKKLVKQSVDEIQTTLKKELRRREKSEILQSINELQKNLRQEIKRSKKKLKQSNSEAEQKKLSEKLQKLDKQLSNAGDDFERIATGIDPGIFKDKKGAAFDWQQELTLLLEPALKEIELATMNARKKTGLKETIAKYEELVPVADKALANLKNLLANTHDQRLKKQLNDLLPDWENVEQRAKNKLDLSRLELDKIEKDEGSLLKSSRDTIKNFFRNRGLYLIIALGTFFLAIILSRIFFQLIFKFVPCFIESKGCLHIRIMELMARITTFILGLFGFLFVLYQFEDWTLLSLSIIFFLGVGWTIRNTIPQMWKQGRIMLNIGSVREGERIILDGIPWLIKDLHFFCTLTNPAIDVTLRIPVENMVGKTSRPLKQDEPWFPCRENDWVILADSMRGKVTNISSEMVELVERGGAHKTYQIHDFLSLSPLNISRNFRLRVPFGISYDHQSQSTTTIRQILVDYIQTKIEKEEFSQGLLNLQVQFNQAGSSSLDLIVLADFSGNMAPLYKKLYRNIQRWCVDACTVNSWTIPFPQRTLHFPEPAKPVAPTKTSPEETK